MAFRIVNCEQGTTEWLAARAGLITGSGVAAIFAKGRGGEPSKVRQEYMDKLVVESLTGRSVESAIDTFAMRQGRQREPIARLHYMLLTGAVVDQVGLMVHTDLPCAVSPDGIIDDGAGGLEIKCPFISTHFEYLALPDHTCPSEYIHQIQMGLWLTGREYWDFMSFNPDFPESLQIVLRRIYPDPAWQDLFGQSVIKFVQEMSARIDFYRKLNPDTLKDLRPVLAAA